MISCNLSKPETTFDQVRKTCEGLQPTDIALVASAIVQAGRCAAAEYDGVTYELSPAHQEALTMAVLREVEQIQLSGDESKIKKSKTTDEEIITLTIPIRASQAAGEAVLGGKKKLSKLLAKLLDEGVEYFYTTTDIGWHWALERVNWSTLTGGETGRRIKFNVSFVDNCLAEELGPGGRKRAAKKKRAK